MAVCGFPLNAEMIECTYTRCTCVRFDRGWEQRMSVVSSDKCSLNVNAQADW